MITIVGESLVDVIAREGSAEPTLHPGGSPANVAVALSRLGQPTTLVTQIGADGYGGLLRTHLERNGVRVVLAGPATAPTSRAIARLGADGVATYQFELSWNVRDLRLAPGSTALHVGSLGVLLEPGGEHVRSLAENVSGRPDVVTSYDPNIRASVTTDRPRAAGIAWRLAARADIVKMSDEDLGWLFPGTTPEQVAARLLGRGPDGTKLLVVTFGSRGAMVAVAGDCRWAAAVPVEVVDTVGAGDAFMAALLAGLADSGLLSPQALARCAASSRDLLYQIVDQAMAAAAMTCARAGADPPTARELRRFCIRHPAAGRQPGSSSDRRMC